MSREISQEPLFAIGDRRALVLAWGRERERPAESVPPQHTALSCARGARGRPPCALGQTLRDRKLVSLRVDLIILVIGFIFPMISVITDGLTYGSAVTAWAPDYWLIFGK